MMSSDKKPKSLEDLWDRVPRKLLVYVVEGVSLVTKSGAGNPYVKVFVEKQKFKTQSLKHNEDPTWKELFLFEFDEPLAPGTMLNIEVYNKQTIGSDKLIGQAKCAMPIDRCEDCHDVWVDLELPPNMKEKNKELLDGRLGNIHLRLLYSNSKETPAAAPGYNQISDYFITKDIKRRMKTGDILLYSGVGPLDAVIKTLTNTRYSRAALIFRAPNKWTEKEQLYLFEVTRNVGGFPDAYNEKCGPGANIFRLEERLHMLNAKSVWWAPLKERLDPESGAPNMVDWLFEIHQGRQSLNDFIAPLPQELLTLFSSQFEFNVNKAPFASIELNCTQYLLNALRLGGRRMPFGGQREFVAPVALLGLNFFDEPILLRQRRAIEDAQIEKITLGPTVTTEREAAAAIAAAGASAASSSGVAPAAAAGSGHRMTIYGGVSPYVPSTTGSSGGGNAFEQSSSQDSSSQFAPPARKDSVPPQGQQPAAPAAVAPAPESSPAPILAEKPTLAPKPLKKSNSGALSGQAAVDAVDGASGEPSSSPRKISSKKSKKVMAVSTPPAAEPAPAAVAPPPALETPPVAISTPPAPIDDIPPPAYTADTSLPPPPLTEVAPEVSQPPPMTVPTESASKEGPPKLPKKPKSSKPDTMRDKDSASSSSKRERKATHGTDKPKKLAKKPESSSNRLSRRIDGGILANKMEERANAAKILFDFDAENEGELSCKKGDVVRVLDDFSDTDWALVRKEGSAEFGCVPKTFLKAITQ